MAGRRALHFVFKIGNRNAAANFYRQVLGMKVLRHEEFEEGCEAACNGPYDGKWSKTMIGYGDEDDHFVVELTYNYGIKEYKLGNDFQYMNIHSKSAFTNAKEHGLPMKELADGAQAVQTSDGYTFRLYDNEPNGDPVKQVALGVSDINKSVDYWNTLLGMKIFERTDNSATLGYAEDKCKLHLIQLTDKVDHGSAFGRIAFSCPSDQLKEIQSSMQEKNQTILKELVSLPTPGKATVQVVILADPDGHEICFVGDEAFRELSQTDPTADQLLNEAMEKDKSDEWFAKKKAREEARKK